MTSSWRTNIATRLENIAAELAAMNSRSMGGKANVKAQDGGTTIDHVGYRESLIAEQDSLLKQLMNASDTEAAMDGTDGAFEVETNVIALDSYML